LRSRCPIVIRKTWGVNLVAAAGKRLFLPWEISNSGAVFEKSAEDIVVPITIGSKVQIF